MSFHDFALHPLVLQALDAAGYVTPTPVQMSAIPLAIEGHDLLATADTGTGKTAAFMLPALSRIGEPVRLGRRDAATPRILVLTPTRELARQVTEAVRKYGKFLRLNTVDVVGGMPYRDQLRMLSRPVDVVVATPGRLLDHIERQRINLGSVEVLILDEADRMLDMGFLDDVKAIAAACSSDRQTMLFTATLDRRMSDLAAKLLNNPVRVAIARSLTSDQIEQRLHHADDLAHKRKLLHHFASQPEVGKAIVFAATKRDADALAEDLSAAGHAAAALHGDMPQNQRNRTLQRLKTGDVRLLVATDVAARGIDVRDISHVINFDLPRGAEDYIHRIGRTGRAGAAGIAISFAGRADRESLMRIERYTGNRMAVHVVPGLEPQRPLSAPANRRSTGPVGKPTAHRGGHAPTNGGKPAVNAGKHAGNGGSGVRVRPAGVGGRGGAFGG